LRDQLQEKWSQHVAGAQSQTRGKWFKDTSKEFLNGKEASKVALARAYAFRCRETREAPPEGAKRDQAVALCNSLVKNLELPGIKAKRLIEV